MERICTNIEQSKKLIELGLGHETADMAHIVKRNDCREPWELAAEAGNVYTCLKDSVTMCLSDYAIPAWSLTALLELIMPKSTTPVYVDNAYQMVYDVKPYYITSKFDNPLDAAFEMVCWLKENGKL